MPGPAVDTGNAAGNDAKVLPPRENVRSRKHKGQSSDRTYTGELSAPTNSRAEYGDGEGQGLYFQLDGQGRLLGGGDSCSAAPGPELINALTYIPPPAMKSQ